MIREILTQCGGQVLEQARTMFRMWHCWECGLEFSMKCMERPTLCPRCLVPYDEVPKQVQYGLSRLEVALPKLIAITNFLEQEEKKNVAT